MMTTLNTNKQLAKLKRLLDEDKFEAELNKGLVQVLGAVEHFSDKPKVVEKAIVDYHNLIGELVYTGELCQFSDLKLKREIVENLTFHVPIGREELYRKMLDETGAKICWYLEYFARHIRPIPNKAERIYWHHKYEPNPRAFGIYLNAEISTIHEALQRLDKVFKDVNAVRASSNEEKVTQESQQVEPKIEKGEKPTLKNLPQKILLLDKLGFFKLLEVQKLSLESKGKLVSAICGGNADNAVDYIRHCDPERLALDKNPYRNQSSVNSIRDFLNSLNGS